MSLSEHDKWAKKVARNGQVDGHKCMARIWVGGGKKTNLKSRYSGADNVQCSVKRVEGLGCFCKQHYDKDLACKKIDGLDGWYLGIVTEEKPQKIIQPKGWGNGEYSGGICEDLVWSVSSEEKTVEGECIQTDIWSLGC